MDVGWTRVGAYVLCRDDSGRILLTRFTTPGHPDHGKWTMPGGRMDWGEQARDTASREMLEETGLTATLGDVAGVFSRWYTAGESVLGEPGHLACIVFYASEPSGELLGEFDSDDTTDAVQWVSVADLAALPHVELVDFVVEELAPPAGFEPAPPPPEGGALSPELRGPGVPGDATGAGW